MILFAKMREKGNLEILHKNKLNALFAPDWSRGNPYQKLLRAGLENAGVKVSFCAVPPGIFSLNKILNRNKNIDVFHVHWINDFIEHLYWNRNPLVVCAKLWLFWLDLILVRLRGKKLVWTVHNLISHESPSPEIELRARRIIARAANRVVFHSESARRRVEELYGMSLQSNSAIVEHGNFIGYYPNPDEESDALRMRLGILPQDICVLFFGGIRAYKGVEKLISCVRSITRQDLRLIIAGKPLPESLKVDIENACHSDPRIHLELGHVPDKRVAELFCVADVVVLPFERTLTSGSVLLAMSMGKGLLLPEEARSLDVIDDNGALFFANDRNLVDALGKLKRDDFQDKGAYNLEQMRKVSWDDIGRRLAKEYVSA